MIKPSLRGRDILQLRNTEVTFGINMGYSDCPEHSDVCMSDYIINFTRVDKSASRRVISDDCESLNRMRHWGYLTDGTDFSEASKYLLPDRTRYVCKEVGVRSKVGGTNPALVDGEYYVVILEGFRSRGFENSWIKGNTNKKLVYAEDISGGFGVAAPSRHNRFLALWGKDEGSIVLFINKNIYSIRDMIHNSLVNGHLALGYDMYGRGLNLICVDRLVSGSGSHIFDS